MPGRSVRMTDVASARVEHDGMVAVVTLAQPPANAMDAASLNELADVFDRLANDVGVTAVVITGEGRSFSAGLDLKAIQHSEPDHQEELIEALNRAFLAVYSCPRLVVARGERSCDRRWTGARVVLRRASGRRRRPQGGTRRGPRRRAVPGRRDRGRAPRALRTGRPSARARRRSHRGPRRRSSSACSIASCPPPTCSQPPSPPHAITSPPSATRGSRRSSAGRRSRRHAPRSADVIRSPDHG